MDPSPDEITALADQLSQLAKDVSTASDPMAKKHQTAALVLQAKKLIRQTQDPIDALFDHIVNGFTIAAILSLMDIGVFEAIPMQGTAKLKEIAQKCDAPEELITRLMRQPTSSGIFTEVSAGEWQHNRLSIGMSEHVGKFGKYVFKVGIEELLPPILMLNKYMGKYGHSSLLATYTETPHSWYNNMLGSTFWEVLSSAPDRLEIFSRCLETFSQAYPVVALFPFEQKLGSGNSPDRVLAVDIGGNRGNAMLDLRKGCPSLQGQLILQDRSVVLDDVKSEDVPGVTKMPHDFFTEQPVKGAQMYYIRRVMHDWQDAEVTTILKAIKPAMAPDSRIIVSDTALPDPVTERDAGACWMDLMMLAIGGKERTKLDWQKLADTAGLKLVHIWMEPEKYGPLCVVEYMLPDAVENGVSASGIAA